MLGWGSFYAPIPRRASQPHRAYWFLFAENNRFEAAGSEYTFQRTVVRRDSLRLCDNTEAGGYDATARRFPPFDICR
jgi:hypothetical protein